MDTLAINTIHSLPPDFAPQARVWIFQSNRPFIENEVEEINEQLYQFYIQWQSHGKEVKGWAKLLYNRFVVALADESECSVGGCSTDSLFRVVKSMERQYAVDFFDRLSITFLVNDTPQVLPMHQVKYALANNYIQKDTLMFNNLVQNFAQLQNEWLIPLNKTWLWTKLNN